MKFVGPSSSDEMVLAFLQAELSSSRFRDALLTAITKHGASNSLIDKPDLADRAENALRSTLLNEYRGWEKKEAVFNSWPADISWYRVELTHEDIGQLRYIDYSYWNELSDNTSLVRVAAANIRMGKTVFEVSNDNYWAVAKLVDTGKTFPPLVLRSAVKNGPYELVEGHLRATAYCLANKPPTKIEAILGIAPEFSRK